MRIKKIFFSLVTVIGLSCLASTAQAEVIRNFETEIQVNQDASILVTEKIDYDFETAEKHGIIRDIKLEQKLNATSSYNLDLELLAVTNETQQNYQHSLSYEDGYAKIKIGEADKLVTGRQRYIIKYKIDGAINNFSDHDELYWNVLGTEWTVPIEQAKARIYFNKTAINKTACYFGRLGATTNCLSSIENGQGVFSQTQLSAGEDMTVVASWLNGLVTSTNRAKYTKELKVIPVWLYATHLAMGLVIFLIFLIVVSRGGLNSQSKNPVVAEYSAPKGWGVSQAAKIFANKNFIFSAEIIDLAVKGYLRITCLPKEKFLPIDYKFNKLKEPAGDSYQMKFLSELFKDRLEVKLSTLQKSQSFSKRVRELGIEIESSLIKDGYLTKKVVGGTRWIVISFNLLILGLLANAYLSGGADLLAFVLTLYFLIWFGLNIFMLGKLKLTATGADLKNKLAGLKLYLTVAEKDRLKFHNAPEKNPAKFEELLPYAMALGVEEKWISQFGSIVTENPTWYQDANSTNFNLMLFAGSMHNFTVSSSNLGMIANPNASTDNWQGAGSGGSGFGGGGFSGGGGGGGGGSSW